MTVDLAMLPLPPAVIARLRTAESLRAEVVGITAERDALRTELDTAGWERDAAQAEAAYLRDDILGKWNEARGLPVDRRIGLLLTAGDTPPPPPEDGADIALVSLSTGDVYIRPKQYRGAQSDWCKYGAGHTLTDWSSMIERGPWVTVDGWRFHDHDKIVERDRKYRDATYAANLGQAEWPDSTAAHGETIKALTERRSRLGDQPEPREWINAWQSLAGATRMAWQSAHRRAEYLTEVIQRTPHDPEWLTADGTRTCNVCLVVEAEHLPIPETATP